jgi:large subunit ribosomal protein L10
MAVTRQKKVEQGEKLAADLQNTSNLIVGSYNKLTVAQDFELRKAIRAAGGKYRVVKNTIAQRASKGTQVEGVLQGLKGVTSIAFTQKDPVALAKALTKYTTDHPEYSVKAGIVEGRVVSLNEIKELATMPGREELFSRLLFLINAPAQRLATVINASGRDLAVVINQGVKENKFGGASSAAESAGGVEVPPQSQGEGESAGA